MYSSRPNTRRLWILVLLTTLLFSRLALASYVCPLPQLQAAASAPQMNSADCAESIDHSKMLDQAQPSLCAQHFSDEKQTTNTALQSAACEPVLFFAYSVPPPVLSQGWPLAAYDSTPGSGVGDDPLFLLTRRLRV
jgi:hypothetical protein